LLPDPGTLLTAAAMLLENPMRPEQSVDGFHTTLEIGSRSSYVPSIAIGV
jgi:hypothetical protein